MCVRGGGRGESGGGRWEGEGGIAQQIAQNAGLPSLFRPKFGICITIASKNSPKCVVTITMLSKMRDYKHYFNHMVLGDTFEIPAAPRRLSRTAAALLYIQTPDQPPKRPHITDTNINIHINKKVTKIILQNYYRDNS